jgi:glutaredoxin
MIKVYLFSMEGCPHCQDMKSMLDSENIDYEVKDIDEYKDEYDEFVKLVDDNEFVPAFLCVDIDNNKVNRHFAIAPDRDFNDLEEAIILIKEFLK